LISSAARISESRTVCSLMAIGPEVEFRKPSVTVSPSTQVPEADSPPPSDPPDDSPEPHPAANSVSEPAATTASGNRNRVFPNMYDSSQAARACAGTTERRTDR
jgi:hypothetical protein